MENWDAMQDLLISQEVGPNGTNTVSGFITDTYLIDEVWDLTLTKAGILRVMGKALSIGYTEFAVYARTPDLADKVDNSVKVLEMDSQHLWVNWDLLHKYE